MAQGSREGGEGLPTTTSVHRWHTVWLHAWTQHRRRYVRFTPAIWKVKGHQQNTVCGLVWKKHSIMSPDALADGLFTSSALRSGWCAWYRACIKMPDAKFVVVTTWVKSSVWKLEFNKALVRAPYCSPWFWNPPRVSQRIPLRKPVCRWLVISSESLDELQDELILWKFSMEGKALRVNMGKTNGRIWRRHSTPINSDGMAMLNVVMVGWRKSRNSISYEVVATVALRKPGQKWYTWPALCQAQLRFTLATGSLEWYI